MAVDFLGVFFPYLSAATVQGLSPSTVQWAHIEKAPRETSPSGQRTGYRDWDGVGGESQFSFLLLPMAAVCKAPTTKLYSCRVGVQDLKA